MTSEAPLYLVSACGTAEEFVAAFRRYADRTGLFVPAAAPLPAGRKGRIAVTLKNGGVMIEGEAEILQSSNKPTVLYGRPGMTIKFVDPDEPSKIVIGELEKARLAMKVPAPSVPPRPAKLPDAPRAVPPAPGGRIDATNALAECVVIGDPSTLRETAGAPRTIGGEGSGRARFVVPSIPTAPRSKTPSIPGELARTPSLPGELPARAKTPSIPGELPPRAKTPSIPGTVPTRAKAPSIPGTLPTRAKPPSIPGEPTAISAGPPQPPRTPAPIATEPGTSTRIAKEPSTPTRIAKEPSTPTPTPIAAEPSNRTAREPSLKMTSIGFPAIDKGPAPAKPTNPLLDTMLGTDAPANPTKEIPAENPLLQTQHGVGAAGSKPVTPIIPGDDEATSIGEAPPKNPTDPAIAVARTPSAEQTAIGLIPEPPQEESSRSKQVSKATSIGFPALRSPFETQPVGVVPPPSNPPKDGDPQPPVVAKPKPGMQGPRGKSPTTPPLTPRQPTPVAPLPIVRPPAKPSVAYEDEQTDLSTAPVATKALPEETPMPQVDAVVRPSRTGGMRASEIMAAIPTEDWTMTPDASAPTVLPSDDKASTAEPTESPGQPPKGPPTGNWTISLDPDAGWSEPQKLPASEAGPAPAPPQPKPAEKVKSGNPVMAVSSNKALDAIEWEEKPTGIGEAKIEIDPTLMEPLKPMPVIDDDDDPVAPPPLGAAPPKPIPTRPQVIPPPLAPMPPMAPASGVPASAIMPATGLPGVPPMPTANTFSAFPTPAFPATNMEVGAAASSRKRILLIAGAAALAVVAGFLLVLVLAGGKAKKAAPSKGSAALLDTGSAHTGSADRAVVAPPDAAASDDDGSGNVEQGSGVGSQEVAITPPTGGSDTAPPPKTDGTCHVDVSSVPTGADVYLAKTKVGTTPGTFDAPCGAPASFNLKKPKFLATERSITPSAAKANKLVVRLGKPMFSIKVTSTPSGATITIGGKSAGVTPTTVKLPSYETSTIALSKPGYASDTQRVTAKTNGQTVHVALKKGGRR